MGVVAPGGGKKVSRRTELIRRKVNSTVKLTNVSVTTVHFKNMWQIVSRLSHSLTRL